MTVRLTLPDVFDTPPHGWQYVAHPLDKVFIPQAREVGGNWRCFRSIPGQGAPAGLDVIVSDAQHMGWWRHVSVARADRIPSWNDLRVVKAAFVGEDRYAYMVFPDRAHYVNIHDRALHLYARIDIDGDGNVLPEFTEGTGSI